MYFSDVASILSAELYDSDTHQHVSDSIDTNIHENYFSQISNDNYPPAFQVHKESVTVPSSPSDEISIFNGDSFLLPNSIQLDHPRKQEVPLNLIVFRMYFCSIYYPLVDLFFCPFLV